MAKKMEEKKVSSVGPARPAAVRSMAQATASRPVRPLKGLLARRLRETQSRKTVLFISTGNTCRSPMAAGYFKKLLEDRKVKNIDVRSAGVMTIPGLLATDESKLMLEPFGVNLDRHRSQPLTQEMLRKPVSELIVLGMTPFHVQMALRCLDEARDRTHLLKEYTNTDPKGRPIPDPMGCTLEVYKKVFRQIKQACDALLDSQFITGKPAKGPRAAKKAAAAKKAKRGKLKPAATAPARKPARSAAEGKRTETKRTETKRAEAKRAVEAAARKRPAKQG